MRRFNSVLSLNCAELLSRPHGRMYEDFSTQPSVYRIVQKSTGRFYVGSTANTKNRLGRHMRDLALNQHHSVFLQRSWNKYGPADFALEVIEYLVDRSWVLFHEQAYIDSFSGKEKLFNTCFVAGNCEGVKQSRETIEKRAAKLRGKKRPDWVGEAISIAKKGVLTSAMIEAQRKAVQKITFRMTDEQLATVVEMRECGRTWDQVSEVIGVSIKPIRKEVSRLIGPEFMQKHSTLSRSIGHKRS